MWELQSNINKLKELSAYLEELEPELSIFFNISVDMFMICLESGEILKVNQAWENCLGWKKEDMIGKPFYTFIHPEDFAKTEIVAARICEKPLTHSFVNRYICKDGTYKELYWRAVCYNGKFYASARIVS